MTSPNAVESIAQDKDDLRYGGNSPNEKEDGLLKN